jgi:hypothetical protein
MRRSLSLVLLGGLLLPGCTLFETNQPETQAPKLRVSNVPPVRPEQVTPENALLMARALNDELDRDLEDDTGR